MSPRIRHRLIAALLLGAMGWALAWSWGYLADARDAAISARREVRACEELARRIEVLRAAKPGDRPESQRQIELSRQIERAAADAGLSGQIARISHEAPRRAADAKSVEKPTRIELVRTTLRQLIVFLHALDQPSAGLRVERLHLAAPAEPSDASTWTADATLINTAPDDGRRNPTSPLR